ncbi:MAG: heme-binding protein [Pseudomonadota bacterium]
MKTLLIISAVLVLFAVGLTAVWVFVVQNVETPAYRVLRAEGRMELRAYPALVRAEIDRSGPRRQALSAGFGPLAGYIFAREREGPKIAMTAPVRQAAGALGTWTVGFILPAGLSPAEAPAPARADLRLTEVPAHAAAAIRFPGHPSDADLAARERELRAWLVATDVNVTGPAAYAYYNDPFTPGFLRRNEVILPIAEP